MDFISNSRELVLMVAYAVERSVVLITEYIVFNDLICKILITVE